MKINLQDHFETFPYLPSSELTTRPMDASDLTEVGKIMLDAYLDTVDYEGESEEDAVQEVYETFYGKYGSIIEASTLILEDSDSAVGAIMLCHFEKFDVPFIVYLMVRSGVKGKGYGKLLTQTAMYELYIRNYSHCCLAVNVENYPALALYKSLGFSVDNSD